MKKGIVLAVFVFSFILSFCSTPAMAIWIDNGKSGDGEWRVDVLDGGESRTGQINPIGPIGLTDIIYDFFVYIDSGADGSAVRISDTNVTVPAFLSGSNEVTTEGNFAGPNGTIQWTSVASIPSFSLTSTPTYNVVLTFSSSQPFGTVRVISYLDEDVLDYWNNILVEIGTPGTDNFKLLTIDNIDDVGLAQMANYNSAQAMTYKGWAADEYYDLQALIEFNGATYSIPGVVDTTSLPPYSDARFPANNAYGPEDITTAIAFDLNPAATNASVIFSLIGLSAVENCTNAIDDDGDGLIDCYDTDCADDPTCQPPATNYGNSNQSGTFAEPVNTATGNYVFQRTDLTIPGRGMPVIFTRTCNSLDTYYGPFGQGWTHSYNIILTENLDDSVTIKQGDGHEEFYDPNGDGTYTPRFGGVFNTLVKNPDDTFTLTTKNQTSYDFNTNGRLMSITDRNGNTLLFAYDGSGNLTTITDTVGRVLTLTYDASNRITQLTDPIGRTVLYSYDTEGNLESVTDPDGGDMTFTYDANHRITEIIDEHGNSLVTNTHDGAGRVVAQTNGRGFITSLAYNTPLSGDTTITDPLGNTTIHTHDTKFRLIEVTDANGNTVGYTYDDNNNRTSITDQNGNTTLFTYDDNGNVTSITDPLSNVTVFTYDDKNNLLSATNARGFTTNFTYDASGNLAEIRDALGNATTFAYDGFGQLIQKNDARGNPTQYTYDIQGNVSGITDAFGNVTILAYDGIGRLLSLTDPNGSTATSSYDLNSRLTQTVDPLGNTTLFDYDPVANLTEITDAKGNQTMYGYDETYNLTAVTDALGNITRYGYDANNNRVSMTNANGKTTTYAFDALNRLSSITDPLGNSTTYTYDPVGNVISVKDANGTTNTFTYDANNRLRRIDYGDGTFVEYSYDANGNRVSMVDWRGTTTYTYDALDRLIEVDHPGYNTVEYAYDSVGNRINLTYSDGKVVQYSYDALNRLAKVRTGHRTATRYYYDASSNLERISYPNGRTTLYYYDAANRLVHIKMRAAGHHFAVRRFRYLLDEIGNRIKVLQVDRSAQELRLSSYTYDALSQLTGVDESHTEFFPYYRTEYTAEYTYDPCGNRITEKNNGDVINYTYDAADRLLQAGDRTFAYDANGNCLTEVNPGGADTTYAYDASNRLIQVLQDGYAMNCFYDGDGNKVEEIITKNGKIEICQFLNDVATALPVVLQENSTHWDHDYVYGLGLICKDTTYLPYPSLKSTYFYHADGLGSTAELSDQRGLRKSRYQYDAWGNILEKHGRGGANHYLFTGEEQDPVTGLCYLRARWYDPSVGRFLNKDPFAGLTLSPQTLNRYLYVFNNSTVLIDPSGLNAQDGAAFFNFIGESGFDRYRDGFIQVVKMRLAEWLIEDQIIKLSGVFASHTTINPNTIGRVSGKIAAYAPLIDIIYSPWSNAYQDTLKHPERDNVEAMARYFIDFTASAGLSLLTIGNPYVGFTAAIAYQANRERIQDVMLNNSITNKSGEILFNTLGGTKLGNLLGL